MGAGVKLPQLPAVAVGTLGLIGLGIPGPGSAVVANSAANSIVLLRAVPPILAPLVPPLLTNPWTAAGLGLLVVAANGPAQALGGFLGDLAGKQDAQGWGSLAPSKTAVVPVVPADAHSTSRTTGTVSATGSTRLTGTVQVGSFVYKPPTYYKYAPFEIGTYTLADAKTAYITAVKWPNGTDKGFRITVQKRDGSKYNIDNNIGDQANQDLSYAVLYSAQLTLLSLSGTALPLVGDYGLGTATASMPGSKLDFQSAEVEAIPIPKPAPTPAYAPGQAPSTIPDITTVPVPGTEESGDKATPKRPPLAPPVTIPKLPVRLPAVQPRPGDLVQTGPDGRPLPQPQPQPKPTDPDSHFVGGVEIGTGQPRLDLISIAKEVGRIENKLARVMPQVGELAPKTDSLLDSLAELKALWDLLMNQENQGEYELSSPCELDDDGERVVSKVTYSGGDTLSVISNKVDALSLLLQVHKDLKQPSCKSDRPMVTGEWVSVNFEGLGKSPNGDKPLRKILRYRDQSFQSLEAHAAHWHKFEWDAGPVCVIHKGLSWGVPQVWAATADEGKRVLRHAANVAGVNLADPKGEWIVTHSDSPRIGIPGRMAIRRLRNGALMVSKRVGSNGLAEYPIPTG